MNNFLEYKGYYGNVEYSASDKIFHGKIIGITDHVTYEGESAETLENNFRDSVEDYLASCRELCKDPEKTYKGNFNIRINPELHKKIATYAAMRKQSLNAAVEDAIREYVSPL